MDNVEQFVDALGARAGALEAGRGPGWDTPWFWTTGTVVWVFGTTTNTLVLDHCEHLSWHQDKPSGSGPRGLGLLETLWFWTTVVWVSWHQDRHSGSGPRDN